MGKIETKICGIDEAGRGAFAGPLVTAAVVFSDNFGFNTITNLQVRDSKELSGKRRLEIYTLILQNCISYSFEVISVDDINVKGINWANLEGFARLIKKHRSDKYIIDGRWDLFKLFNEHKVSKTKDVTTQIGGDKYIPAVMAAGIVAKVERDKIMSQLDEIFPEYYWASNTGHGTQKHIEALLEYGKTKFHRTLYVKTGLKNHYDKKLIWKSKRTRLE